MIDQKKQKKLKIRESNNFLDFRRQLWKKTTAE